VILVTTACHDRSLAGSQILNSHRKQSEDHLDQARCPQRCSHEFLLLATLIQQQIRLYCGAGFLLLLILGSSPEFHIFASKGITQVASRVAAKAAVLMDGGNEAQVRVKIRFRASRGMTKSHSLTGALVFMALVAMQWSLPAMAVSDSVESKSSSTFFSTCHQITYVPGINRHLKFIESMRSFHLAILGPLSFS